MNRFKFLNFINSATRLFAVFYIVSAITFPLLTIGAGLGLIPCDGVNCHLKDFGCLAENVIDFLLFKLAAPLAVISFLIGGVLMITAAGNQNQLERGKSIFYNTVIGIMLAFGAWLIVDLILQNLLDLPRFGNPLKDIETCSTSVLIEV